MLAWILYCSAIPRLFLRRRTNGRSDICARTATSLLLSPLAGWRSFDSPIIKYGVVIPSTVTITTKELSGKASNSISRHAPPPVSRMQNATLERRTSCLKQLQYLPQHVRETHLSGCCQPARSTHPLHSSLHQATGSLGSEAQPLLVCSLN
jgi:hypothetical protein